MTRSHNRGEDVDLTNKTGNGGKKRARHLTPYFKINSRWIIKLNVKTAYISVQKRGVKPEGKKNVCLFFYI